MRVLIVEDEGLIARFVARALQAEGYTTSVAPNGEVACRRLRDEEWGEILDLLLPAKSGFEVLRELSRAANQVPVLVLSARRSVDAKVAALDAGATDFLAKPFALDELLARVRALLRRGRSPAETEPGCEADLEFTLDGRSRTLCWGDGRTLSLSEREFGLLEYLVRSPNQTVSRERILSAVWEYQFDPRSNVVDVYVGRLRRKLHPAIRIETVRGGGYRLMTG